MTCDFSSLWDEKPRVCPGKHVIHGANAARERRAVEQHGRKVRAGEFHRLRSCPVPREAAELRQ